MKYGIAVLALLGAVWSNTLAAQEANAPPPPPPPEVEEEEDAAPAQPAEKKVKLDHCGPQSAKTCDGLEDVTDLGGESWKIGVMRAALCSKSASIEASRKRRKDRLEYEERLAEIAEDNEQEYTPWVPPESNSEFAQRTASECESNKDYWCQEMQLAAAAIGDAETQVSALEMVETACAPPE